MEKVRDITSLQAYQEYKEAEKNLKQYRERREQFERKIQKSWDAAKAKTKEIELASSFSESEKLSKEAQSLRQDAKTAKEQFDEWEADQPRYGNLLGDAKKKLEAEAKPFLIELQERAQSEIDDAVEVIEAIHSSKEKFHPNTLSWIPKVSAVLNELKQSRHLLKQTKIN